MPHYSGIQKEETLKSLVHRDYFSRFGYEPNIGGIDFVITDPETVGYLSAPTSGSAGVHFLWAEAKKDISDVFAMFTQLILTCRKTYEKGVYLAPPWLGCFDEARIAFVPFHEVLPIFSETDFNWNTRHSDYGTADFQKARRKIENLIRMHIRTYSFDSDDADLREFIKTHFVPGAAASIKMPITKDNFVQIFIKWVKEVKPFINIAKNEWTEFKNNGILDCDFFRADTMSENGNAITITEKLKIILEKDNYKLQENIKGRLFQTNINFTDDGAAYNRFWNRYERPPAEEYQQHIIDRRDLLVPANIRERKGSFFTPKIWADKSKEYLAKVFGDNWQNEYYIWDCAAGTGNLLAGLTNKYNVWASDIEAGNVETMQSLIDIDENLNLLSAHIFQFDFLNDILTKADYERQKEYCAEHNLPPPERKLPPSLCDIIDDPEKRKKLIVYINPPYAEAASYGEGENKRQVAAEHNTSLKYKESLGKGINELFANFFVRIYYELSDAKLASFSTLKYLNSQNFIKFRECFFADYKGGFICEANTFDNVKGKFPIGFLIWDLSNKKNISKVKTDILLHNIDLTQCHKDGTKYFYATNNNSFIIDWLRHYFDKKNSRLAYLRFQGTDFQTNNHVFFTLKPSENDIRESKITNITKNNLIEMCIYLSVRQCIEATWLNNRDQFYFPGDGYKTDIEFQNNCLIFSLFHGQNRISSRDGTNHWIPFSEKEVGAREKFESAFMSEFLKKRGLTTNHTFPQMSGKVDHTNKNENIKEKVRDVSEVRGFFSSEALAVLDAGRELWKYYHAKIKDNKTASHNASFYDIREYFQERKENGNMNTKSTDETYNTLIADLRGALKVLTSKIQPKVYEYGFLRE